MLVQVPHTKGDAFFMAGKEVSKSDRREVQQHEFEKFVKFVQDRAEIDLQYNPSTDLMQVQVNRIMQAESLDDLFSEMHLNGLTGLKDVPNGTIITITDYRLVKSTRADVSTALGTYAIINGVNPDGEEVVYDTSVERLVSFLLRADYLRGYR
jgi:hypothetical protein